jgi:Fe-S-cluster-containing hydrogenase component 2
MCESPIVDDRLIQYFITRHPLHKINVILLQIYYHHVRVMQVKCLDEPIDVRYYTVETCECRLNIRNCNNRLDTCFKKTKGDNAVITENKIRILSQENLVRIEVNTANWKYEICHCCVCCCFPVRVHNLFPGKLIFPSNFEASINPYLCSDCKKCLTFCPFGAINDMIEVEKEKCLGCGICKKNCQAGAITMIKRDPRNIPNPNKPISILFLVFFHMYFYILLKCNEFLHLHTHKNLNDIAKEQFPTKSSKG